MKKYIVATAALSALMVAVPALAQTGADVNVNAEATIMPGEGRPPMMGGKGMLGAKANMELRKENMEKRGEIRDNRQENIENRMDKRDDMLDKRDQKMEDRMEKRDEHRTDMMQKFDEKTQAMRLKFQEMFAQRAIRGVAQVTNLAARFETHIAKLKASGTVTTEAEAQLAVVKSAITTAKAKLDALKALYPTDGSELTDAQKTAVTAAKTDAEAAIKATHEAMKKLLDMLKGLKMTTTTSTTTTTQ